MLFCGYCCTVVHDFQGLFFYFANDFGYDTSNGDANKDAILKVRTTNFETRGTEDSEPTPLTLRPVDPQGREMSISEQTHPNPITHQEEEDDEEVGKLAVRLANAVILPMVLKSALELNIVEIISDAGAGAFLSPSEIAAKLPTKNQEAPVLLDRMLRLLASYSILRCTLRTRGTDGETERLYGAGPICKFLLKNTDEGSVAPLFLLHHDKVFMESW